MYDDCLYWFGVFTIGAILSVNIPVLWVIKKVSSITLINNLITIDCILCLGYIPGIIVQSGIYTQTGSIYSCSLRICFNFFINLLNRVLPVGIVAYRYVYVCKSHLVFTGTQQKLFKNIISHVILWLIVGLTIGCFLYREKYSFYWVCMGQEGFFDNKEYNGFHFHLPIYNPFHFISVFLFFLHSFLLPVGYFAIYRFRNHQNSIANGLTDRSRSLRKKRNIVTAKMNTIIWLSEMCSYLVLIPQDNICSVLYFLISGTVTPFLYYYGIEANRKAAKDHVMDIFKESRRKVSLRK